MADSKQPPPPPAAPAAGGSSESSSSTTKPGSDFLPSDTLSARFRNFYRMAFGKMSPEGQKRYWEDADQRYSEFDCRRCEEQRDYLLKFSPVVRYMTDNITKLGGSVGPHNVRCRTCKTGQLGGFDHKYGIMICANYVEKRSVLEDVLTHEMVHAYDHLRFKTDLSAEDDLRHAACSEVSHTFPYLIGRC
jgi:inner membrane protease ATP23